MALEGSCRTAVGAYATLNGRTLDLVVEGLASDGSRRWRRTGHIDLPADAASARDAAFKLGLDLGEAVRRDGGDALTPPG